MSSVPTIMGGLFTVAVIFGPGLLLLILGIRGRLILDDPRCAKCRHDLKTFGERHAKCPECGASLGRRGAVAFGSRQRRPVLIIVGAVLMVLAPLVMVGASLLIARPAVAQAAAARAAQGQAAAAAVVTWASVSNGQLAAAVPSSFGDGMLFAEINARIRAKGLSESELGDVVESFIRALPPDFPPAHRFAVQSRSEALIASLVGHPALSREQRERLVLAWTGPTPVAMRSRVREDTTAVYSFYGVGMPSVGLNRVMRFKEVRVDGVPVVRETPAAPRTTRERRDLPLLAPGTHTIEFDVEWVAIAGEIFLRHDPSAVASFGSGAQLMSSGDAMNSLPESSPLFERLDAIPDPASALNRRVAHGTELVTHTLTVFRHGEPAVTPVVDPSLRTMVRDSFTVTEAEVSRHDDGRCRLRVQVAFRVLFEVPLAIRARVEIRDRTFRSSVGTAWSEGRSLLGGETLVLEEPLDDLDPKIRYVRVVIEPALSDVRLSLDFDRAWGEEIDLGKVPVRRLDLESAPARESGQSQP